MHRDTEIHRRHNSFYLLHPHQLKRSRLLTQSSAGLCGPRSQSGCSQLHWDRSGKQKGGKQKINEKVFHIGRFVHFWPPISFVKSKHQQATLDFGKTKCNVNFKARKKSTLSLFDIKATNSIDKYWIHKDVSTNFWRNTFFVKICLFSHWKNS